MDEYLLVQFERLADLAVVTNIVPLISAALAAPAVLQQEGASRKRVLTGMAAAAGFFYFPLRRIYGRSGSQYRSRSGAVYRLPAV